MRKLYEILSSFNSIEKAWKSLNKENKESRGLSNETVHSFKENEDENLKKISNELQNRTFTFSDTRASAIEKRNSLERRPLQIPEIRDRVVLKAISHILEKEFEKEIKKNADVSFAYQAGVGIKNAIEKITNHYKDGYVWVLEGVVA